MAANKGWICLHRSIKDSAIWTGEEPFDQRSAWIDLLLTANHEDREIFFDGHVRTVKRGQMLTSVEKLSVRWKWNKKKTLKFLRLLEEAKMIERKSDKRGQQITLLNYAKYQGFQGIEGQQMGHQYTHQDTHQVPDSMPTNNNDNNYNNDNNMAAPATHSFTPYVYKDDSKPRQTQFHKDMQTNKYDFAALEQYLLERDRPKGDEL
jgi:DNA replication protein DnaD